ncbi:hypothetical protein TIFTF001_018732 [Ficus carica]|uniref:Uncharacterized protein n=1 Tax=Ficus carica TaxID=3494 RepID=A0AA88ANU9_FICCA|nr:hypothetical protein TIFTF001_018732 [Ficus carica]
MDVWLGLWTRVGVGFQYGVGGQGLRYHDDGQGRVSGLGSGLGFRTKSGLDFEVGIKFWGSGYETWVGVWLQVQGRVIGRRSRSGSGSGFETRVEVRFRGRGQGRKSGSGFETKVEVGVGLRDGGRGRILGQGLGLGYVIGFQGYSRF